MSRGISLHIGLNNVDTSAYPGYTIPVLSGCINDANSMCNIARTNGFETSETLLDGQATAMNVKNKIMSAASELSSGDFYFLTYSGHGSQIPDEMDQEDDGYNETWVLYDRQLIDDELYSLWSTFQEGVRIFVLSDSCHSGTMVRMLILNSIANKKKEARNLNYKLTMNDVDNIFNAINSNGKPSTHRRKSFPEINSLKNYLLNKNLYQNIQQLTKLNRLAKLNKVNTPRRMAGLSKSAKLSRDIYTINASLIYISGCQDNQLSGDGAVNGVFTGSLLSVWNNGSFNGTYNSFYDGILSLMPSDQTPNYMTLGINLYPFESQKPFTVTSPSGGADTPATVSPGVTAPASCSSADAPPTFNVDKGSNPYYYVEVATDYNLFNYNSYGTQRNESNFYATWNDPSTNYALLNSAQYQLPQNVWNQLKNARRLYYRVGSTIDTQWNGWMITVSDEDCPSAPFIEIIASQPGSENGSSLSPGVTAPASCSSEDAPPIFNVDKGSNPYYYVEVATDYNLFNYNSYGTQRNETNFYATWNDLSTNYALLSSSQYQLPQNVWNQLKHGSRLYYRVGSTIDTQWNGWMITVSDEDCASAPFIEIIASQPGSESGSSLSPGVTAPASCSSEDAPPTFNVDKGSNPYYYVEVATDYNLFNYNSYGTQRNETNFYATWNDPSTNYALLNSPEYQLPQTVWDQLKNAERLYYRVGTAIDTQWNGWMVTVSDEDCASAPFIEITSSRSISAKTFAVDGIVDAAYTK